MNNLKVPFASAIDLFQTIAYECDKILIHKTMSAAFTTFPHKRP